ncbi:hypothetical protein SNE40_021270 [Patella caerulea]|uniref:Uncharacterized protein n=1 Tax=Patella caerulea TaxID=87958 RepID=A0AAN8IWG7_PATCE
MREAIKSQLADTIGQMCPSFKQTKKQHLPSLMVGPSSIESNGKRKCRSILYVSYIVYVDLVKQNVGPVVVFDGYGNGPSTKDGAHQRRTRGVVGYKISGFMGTKVLTTTKERFLSNETNKNNFIILLKTHLESQGIRTRRASGDADCLISQTGVDLSATCPTVVIGEDTDLLVILCYRANRLGTPTGRLFLRNINCGTLAIYAWPLVNIFVQDNPSSMQLLDVIPHLVCSASGRGHH